MSKHLQHTSCIILWLFYFLAISSPTYSNNETDFQSLLAFKKAMHSDPNGVLTSWNGTLPFCSWQGILCSQRHQNRVASINLLSQGLSGSISPHLGNLSFLRFITLQNNSFYGQIPDEIGRLRRLRVIDFSNNSLSGEIPRNLSQCADLYSLNLIDNNLTGQIIPDIGALQKLKRLGLGNNYLSGSIPPSMGNLTSLVLLSMQNCGIDGDIPDFLAQLKLLKSVLLGENSLTGRFPFGLFNVSTISTLSVPSNRLQGAISPDIGLNLPSLSYLDLGDNHFSGAVPFSLSNCSLARVIRLSFNNFTSLANVDFSRLSALEYLVITNNQLVGDLRFISSLINCTYMKTLNFQRNLLTGILPDSISNLSTTLSFLALGHNRLHGSIPSGIENLLGLSTLSFEFSNLEGPIPVVMGKLSKLQVLYLSTNRLTNVIPFSFGNLTLLNELYLDQNYLNGSIPRSLGNCTDLLALDISSNILCGPLPPELLNLASISISFNLSHNAFTGSIPLQVGSLINLVSMDLSHNRLSGPVPSSLSSCVRLEQLYLDGNLLSGEISNDLRTLRGLQYLDASQNNISGVIPRFLGELDLAYLNLSHNRLEGEVPTLKVFLNETAVSLEGNNALCGGIPSLKLPPCSSKNSMKEPFPTLFIVLITVISVGAVCIVISACLYLYVFKQRGSDETQRFIHSPEGDYLRLSYADLSRYSSGFSDANLLGAGRYGSVYKAILNDGQTLVAVKVLNLNTRGASKSFVSECMVLREVRHRNLVKIVSTCSSIDVNGNEFKALVYEYMANGNLDEWLHSKSGDQTRKLSFRQRLNVAIDIASALEYLHFGTNSVIVHGDLKPSNVLLDKEMTAHVSDFGLAEVVSDICMTEHGSSSIAIKGTVGYLPPEYGMGGMVSTDGDVYSFGIILLEMFTGIRPTSDELQNFWSLHEFVLGALPSQVMEIVDPVILGAHDRHETCAKIKKCVSSILEIGVACSRESPRERMFMTDVVNELHKTLRTAMADAE